MWVGSRRAWYQWYPICYRYILFVDWINQWNPTLPSSFYFFLSFLFYSLFDRGISLHRKGLQKWWGILILARGLIFVYELERIRRNVNVNYFSCAWFFSSFLSSSSSDSLELVNIQCCFLGMIELTWVNEWISFCMVSGWFCLEKVLRLNFQAVQ